MDWLLACALSPDTALAPAVALLQPALCSEISARRKSQVGTGSRSEKIKTYNYKDTRMSGGCCIAKREGR